MVGLPADNPVRIANVTGVVEVKAWLLGISPMVWRQLLVPDACTLRDMHGIIQVAMDWEEVTP